MFTMTTTNTVIIQLITTAMWVFYYILSENLALNAAINYLLQCTQTAHNSPLPM